MPPQSGRDGGLANAALLIADHDAAGDGRTSDVGGGVGVEPELHGLREPLDEGDASVSGDLPELLPLSGREEGGEGIRSCGVNARGSRGQAAPFPDALLNRTLNIDSALGGSDLEVLPELSRQFGDDLLAVAGGGWGAHGDTILTS